MSHATTASSSDKCSELLGFSLSGADLSQIEAEAFLLIHLINNVCWRPALPGTVRIENVSDPGPCLHCSQIRRWAWQTHYGPQQKKEWNKCQNSGTDQVSQGLKEGAETDSCGFGEADLPQRLRWTTCAGFTDGATGGGRVSNSLCKGTGVQEIGTLKEAAEAKSSQRITWVWGICEDEGWAEQWAPCCGDPGCYSGGDAHRIVQIEGCLKQQELGSHIAG